MDEADKPGDGPVRIKLSGDMQRSGVDVITIGGKYDVVRGDVAAIVRGDAEGADGAEKETGDGR